MVRKEVLEFMAYGVGFGVWDLGFRGSGLGSRVSGFGVYQKRFGAVRHEGAPAVRARHWSHLVLFGTQS